MAAVKLWNYVNRKMTASRQRSVWVDHPALEDDLRRVLDRERVVVRGEDGFPQEDLVALEGRPKHRAAGHAGGGGGRLVPEGQTLQGKIGKWSKSFSYLMPWTWIEWYRELFLCKTDWNAGVVPKCTVLKRWCLTRGHPTPPTTGCPFCTPHCIAVLTPENVGL